MLAGLSLAVRYHLPCLPRRTHSVPVFNEGSANSLELVLPKKDGLQADSGAVTKALSQKQNSCPLSDAVRKRSLLSGRLDHALCWLRALS